MAGTTNIGSCCGRRFLPKAFSVTWKSLAIVCGVVVTCVVLLAAGIAAALLAEHLVTLTYSTQIRVTGGEIRGRERQTPAGTTYLSFQGIPYAAPPIGDLRFRAPQPVKPWEGVLDVLKEGNLCPQPHKIRKGSPVKSMGSMLKMVLSMPGMAKFMVKYILRMDEDCLVLNVYTPQLELPSAELKPVVVFIHGGAFLAGNGDMSMYGPDYLIEQGLVVVTLNYRLGALGFLHTNSSAAPGNAGLKDQVLAMRWVRENIQTFGGDPKSITLYGESAGSASVHFHLLSPMSKGLFHRAILSSSTSQNYYALTTEGERYSRSLALECGADNATADDPDKRVAFLRGVMHATINDRLANVLGDADMRSVMGHVPFVPVVEAELPGEEAFLTSHPNVLLREGWFTRVPMIIGSNSKEGSLFYTGVTRPPNDEGLKMIDDDLTSAIPDPVYDRLTDYERGELANRIRQLYFKGGHVNNQTIDSFIDLFGDELLMHGIHISSLWHARHSTLSKPVYLYHFTMASKVGLSFFFSSRNLKGAGHGEELSYVWRQHLFKDDPNMKQTGREKKARARMVQMLSNFIKTGNPTPAPSAEVGVHWPPATLSSMRYLEVGDDLTVRSDLLKERMEFWDRVIRDVTGDPLYAIQ